MNKKITLLTLFILILGLLLVGCSGSSNNSSDTQKSDTSQESSDSNSTDSDEPVHVVMELNGGKKVELELYPDKAPKTVENFVKLAKAGFYDGLTFHRVIPGFMIQGGDPTATGTGGSDETIEGEFPNNGFDQNDLKHERGVISMARSQDNDSASSQFFIMLEDTPSLDGDYAAFGKVTSGMEEIDKIAEAETDENDKPLEDQVIEKVYVED